MAASFLVHPAAFQAPLAPGSRRRSLPAVATRGQAVQGAPPFRIAGAAGPWLLAASLVLLAALVAPERPQDQEAICQRQAGVEACRVW